MWTDLFAQRFEEVEVICVEEINRKSEGSWNLGAIFVLVDEIVDVPGNDVTWFQRVHIGGNRIRGVSLPLAGLRVLGGENAGTSCLISKPRGTRNQSCDKYW